MRTVRTNRFGEFICRLQSGDNSVIREIVRAFDPLILILYQHRERSPLATNFYRNMARLPKVYADESGRHLSEIIKDKKGLSGEIPDYIILGFGTHNDLNYKESDFINRHGIRVIRECGDPNTQMASAGSTVNRWLPCLYGLLHRMPADWPQYDELFRKIPHIRKFFLPWAIDTRIYSPIYSEPKDKPIDVAMISTIGEKWRFHVVRRKWARVVKSGPWNSYVGNAYGVEYLSYLQNSKIVVVESSARKALTQKYLEGAASGAMMIGDIPYGQGGPDSLLQQGESFVEVNTDEELAQAIQYYLERPELIKKISDEARNRVVRMHELNNSINDFMNLLVSDYLENYHCPTPPGVNMIRDYGVMIGKGTIVEPGVTIGNSSLDVSDGQLQQQTGRTMIGDNCFIGSNSTISRGRDIETPTVIEDNVIVGPQVLVGHGVQIKDGSVIQGNVTISGFAQIGPRARIGAGATIRNRVVVGEGALIAMGSVVTRDVDPFTIVMGNPARYQHYRNRVEFHRVHGEFEYGK